MCDRDVALKSPDRAFTVTSDRSMSAFTEVKRTGESLFATIRREPRIRNTLDLPFLVNHLSEVTMIHNALEYRAKGHAIMSTEGSRESDNRYSTGFRRGGWTRSSGIRENNGIKVREDSPIPGI